LVVTKTVDKRYVHRYEDLTYTITVHNSGHGSASDLVISDEISGHLEWIRLGASKGTVLWNSGTRRITASVGRLNPGENVTVTVTGRVVNIPSEKLPVAIRNIAVAEFVAGQRVSNEVLAEVVYFAPGEVPEPGTILMFGSGLLGLAGYARTRLRRKR
jgi:uncharacterized repeat protein (TIGR01451 family)